MHSRPSALDKSKAHESISGLGEAPILNASPADSTLSILYKGRIVIVSAVGSKNPGLKAVLVQTAKQILARYNPNRTHAGAVPGARAGLTCYDGH
jgi:hypothetical protein